MHAMCVPGSCALAINNVLVWTDWVAELRELRRVTRPGRITVGFTVSS